MKIKSQEKWDKIGLDFLKEIETNPEKYIIKDVPINYKLNGYWRDLKREIGNISGKKILEVGCGRGQFSVFLAKQGAKVTAFDIGKNLILC